MQKTRKISKHAKDFNIIVERDSEGFFVASVAELPGCYTQAKSLDRLMKRIKEAIDLYLEVPGNKNTDSKFVGIYRIAL